ncbi:unnamed protein product [Sphagnum jensenii]|uniref:Uncharacterized protein n=1 Tax=Sphagnum jensenii TaxID=128206 RepID=A0ABP1BJS4_9BRYO
MYSLRMSVRESRGLRGEKQEVQEGTWVGRSALVIHGFRGCRESTPVDPSTVKRLLSFATVSHRRVSDDTIRFWVQRVTDVLQSSFVAAQSLSWRSVVTAMVLS